MRRFVISLALAVSAVVLSVVGAGATNWPGN
jgi:hypothetical protein